MMDDTTLLKLWSWIRIMKTKKEAASLTTLQQIQSTYLIWIKIDIGHRISTSDLSLNQNLSKSLNILLYLCYNRNFDRSSQ